MDKAQDIDAVAHGRLAQNVVHFTRALRAAGLPVGTGHALKAVEAIGAAGFEERGDFYNALAACLTSRPEHRVVFDQCFHMFWRDPRILERMMSLMIPEIQAPAFEREKKAGEKRAAEGLSDGADDPADFADREPDEIEIDASLSFSDQEVLNTRDFDQMSASEIAAAKRAIKRLSLPVRPITSRRTAPANLGSLPDWRRTMRDSLRGTHPPTLARRERRVRWPALVALCDISGSMASYSR
ncbi:MAG: VWA domain-containing protein, partial [Paracoccaceae bacterium]